MFTSSIVMFKILTVVVTFFKCAHINSTVTPYIPLVLILWDHKILGSCTYVTGYWKTDHNVTLGQLHFIGPANSHTHALSMH